MKHMKRITKYYVYDTSFYNPIGSVDMYWMEVRKEVYENWNGQKKSETYTTNVK